MATPKAPLTAKSIREFGRANPAFVATLSEAGQAAFAPGKRGRMSVEVRKAASKAMGRATHVEGTPKTVPLTFKNDKGRKVIKHVPEGEARRLAGSVAGKRGPLSRAALAEAAKNYTGK